MNPYVLLKPVITEKALAMAKEANAYTFYVDRGADKRAIKQAIEIGFGVKVIDLKTVALPGVTKRTGSRRIVQKTSPRKKAIAVLPAGQKIELFDL
jgi:large subunit ribosomal protein L23